MRAVRSGMEPAVPAPEWDSTLPAEVRRLADRLLPMFYADLKRVAHHERSRVAGGMTLGTTALVHEAYLKLRGVDGWNDDAHFIRAAALAMRHALVDHAIAQLTAKRGEGAEHVPLTESLDLMEASDEMLVALDEALAQLATQSLRLAQVVECRYFAGYDEVATAKALGISERTVRRDWKLARAWLLRELRVG
jgi:RNA polymerase sigma factor (TIGR02999 family)